MKDEKTETQTDPKQIDATIEALEKHVEDESPTGVTRVINGWQKTLEEHKEFKKVSADLETLKDALAAKDGKKIVKCLTSLGEETTKAAEDAEGDEGKKVKMLGKALTAAAKAVGKLVH